MKVQFLPSANPKLLNLNQDYPSKKTFSGQSLAGGANDVPWGRKDLLGGPEAGKTILINYIMNFIQDSCQRFSHFKSTFLSLIQVYCITQKMQVSQNLAFLSTALQCHETELFCTFPAKKLYPLEKSSPSKCTFSRLQLLA